MQFIVDLLFPIDFATIWGRRVFLSLLVLVLGGCYVVVHYFFSDSIVPVVDEEISTEKLILDIQTAEKNLDPDTTLRGELLSRRDSFVLFFHRLLGKFKSTTVMSESDFDEEIESLVLEDGFDVQEDVLEESVETPIIGKDILMTEKKAKEIDDLTRSNIQRKEFESELNYLKKKQQREEYEKKLIEGLAQDNTHSGIIEHLSQYYIDQQQYKKALSLLKKLLDQDANNHKVLRQMADIYLVLEDVETSEVLVKRALSLNANNPKYAITLVEIYYNTKRKDIAITLMEDIVKRRPENLGYRDTLAKLYEEMRDYDLAIECYQSMLMIDPKNITIKRKLLETRTKVEK